jgi:hypothetical protein
MKGVALEQARRLARTSCCSVFGERAPPLDLAAEP